jgi:hypothetical protein
MRLRTAPNMSDLMAYLIVAAAIAPILIMFLFAIRRR